MPEQSQKPRSPRRRQFLAHSVAGAVGTLGGVAPGTAQPAPERRDAGAASSRRPYNGPYEGDTLSRVAFPLGGIGAGMICLEGGGALSHVSLRHEPDLFKEPCVFAAVHLRGEPPLARVLEGPVPAWKRFGLRESGNGGGGATWGLPRFARARFEARFPFATITLADDAVPLAVEVTGWSPFEPGDAFASSLPFAALEYRLTSRAAREQSGVFSWNARNFMPLPKGTESVRPIRGGFVLQGGGPPERPGDDGAFCATTSDPDVRVNPAWFRGGWFDALTLAWRDVEQGACYARDPVASGPPSPGATLFVPFTLAPGATKAIELRLAWYVPASSLRTGDDPEDDEAPGERRHRPWYAGRFASIDEAAAHWQESYGGLREKSARFASAFQDQTLPPEVIEAVAANLTILKSPTVMRQADGRLWSWEGCGDSRGCCSGSCTHVWNYAQALPHLFPALERTLRETEFRVSQNARGHQAFRAALPIRPPSHDFHAAADGQLGGVMKVFREWRVSGDTEWLRGLWPSVRTSLDYCIETWDPRHTGALEEPHHNTYDIEFWGPDGMCTSFYLGALRAAVLMGEALSDPVLAYAELFERGRRRMEGELWNGEYFVQKVEWKGLRAGSPLDTRSMVGEYSAEARTLLEQEGPKYQYGAGCLSDGVLGAWLAAVCGVGEVLDREKTKSHLLAVHRHNLKRDLSAHANPQRPTFAFGAEGGLLLCSWPRGGQPALPFVYSNEVWTGIEYQVASHLMLLGRVDEGLEIVRSCRDRYDGRTRNPFDEYECGHWYARAMSSYGLIQGLAGVRYDAVERVLYVEPRLRGDFRSFLATATGYGTAGVRDGRPFLEVRSGAIDVARTEYRPAV